MVHELDRALTLFRSVVLLDREERSVQLARACAGDTALRRQVEDLLDHHDAADSRFDTRGLAAAARPDGVFGGAEEPMLGGYRDLQRIGAGGMGVVYRATQEHPRRDVALKMLRFDAQTPETLARFAREAQFLAQLQHPGIAQVFDVGTFRSELGEVPYFTMELLDGEAIDRFCAERGLDVRARCRLCAALCDAVQHAHERGVVHRDLKPSNVIVVAGPDGGGQPKVLDFGIARGGDDGVQHTRTGQVLGTLAYMSPEQARNGTVDHRADVYTIGVMLYELLVGRLPFDPAGMSMREVQDVLEHDEPTRLGQVDPALRGDLEVIVEKAMAKDPERRYPSAAELAADLRRFLADQPIRARRASAIYFVRKTLRRHRVLVSGVVATMLALSIGAGATLVYASRESSARMLAEHNERESRRNELEARGALLTSVATLYESGRHWAAMEQLQNAARTGPAWPRRLLAAASPRFLPAVPGFTNEGHWDFVDEDHLWAVDHERRPLLRACGGDTTPRRLFADGSVQRLWSPRPSGFAMGSTDDEGMVVDWRREVVLRRFPRHGGGGSLVISDDGSTFSRWTEGGVLVLCVDGEVVATADDAGGHIALSPDGRLAVLCDQERTARVFDVAARRVIHTESPSAPAFTRIDPIDGGAWLLRWAAERPGFRDVRHARFVDGSLRVSEQSCPADRESMVRMSADGTLVAIPRASGVLLRDARTGGPSLRSVLQQPDGLLPFPISAPESYVSLSPSGRRIALSRGGRPCYVVDLDEQAGEPGFDPRCVTLRGHSEWVYHVAVSHDGRHVVSSAPEDPEVRVWDAVSGSQVARLERAPQGVASWDALLAFSADDTRVVFTGPFAGGRGAGVIDWVWRTGEVDVTWPDRAHGHANHLPLLDRYLDVLQPSPRERLGHKVQMVDDLAVAVWCEDADSLPIDELPGGRRWRLAWRPPGRERYAALAVHPQRPEVALVHDSMRSGWRFSPLTPAGVVITDPEREAVLARIPFPQGSLMCAAYSPDGTLLAVGTRRGTILLFETEFYTLQLQLRVHDDYVYSLVWTPDDRLVTVSGDRTIRIWDPDPEHRSVR